MPRQARKISHSKVYHCMLRGINKQDIFFDKHDYIKFQEIIKKSKKFFSYQLYSYVLMPNHIHLEIKDENQKLSQIMHAIGGSYAMYFNKKYARVGHVFENRFCSKTVESSYYVLNLLRYIHQNPVKAGIGKIDGYVWSSYLEYLKSDEIEENKIVNTKDMLLLFSQDEEQAIREFIKFNEKSFRFQDSIELLEYEMRNNLTDEELIYFIREELGITNIQEVQKYATNYRDNTIQRIRNIQGVTQQQIARVLGINIKMVKRAYQKGKLEKHIASAVKNRY